MLWTHSNDLNFLGKERSQTALRQRSRKQHYRVYLCVWEGVMCVISSRRHFTGFCYLPCVSCISLNLCYLWLEFLLCALVQLQFAINISNVLLCDFVLLNIVLDRAHINLPLTNWTNDAHPKGCLYASISVLSFPPPVLSYWSRLTQHIWCFYMDILFLFSFLYHTYLSHLSRSHYLSLSIQTGPQSLDPQTEDASGATLGVRSGQWTHWGRWLKAGLGQIGKLGSDERRK